MESQKNPARKANPQSREAPKHPVGLAGILERASVVCGILSAILTVLLIVLVLCGKGFWEVPVIGLISAIYLLLATSFYGATRNQEITKTKRRLCFWTLLAAYAAFLLHSGLALILVLALF